MRGPHLLSSSCPILYGQVDQISKGGSGGYRRDKTMCENLNNPEAGRTIPLPFLLIVGNTAKKQSSALPYPEAPAQTGGKIVKIVVTGGPCAGKTTLMAKAVQALEARGVRVLIVPEAATTLIAGMHIAPADFSMEGFQKYVMDNQFALEAVVDSAALEMANQGQNVVVLCDRGKLDGLAYVDTSVIADILAARGTNIIEVRDSYDLVVHLVTAANGAEEAYTLSNNAARSETPEQARALDIRTLNAWTGHPHLAIIGNTGSFQEKITAAIEVIYNALGIPVPVERERKFLALMPDIKKLARYNPVASQIVQTYLHSSDGVERRVRQRGDGETFSFYYTEKQDLDGLTDRIERESMISARQYAAYLAQADGRLSPVRKTRYCFPYRDQYLEMDVYDGETQYVTIEVEGVEKDAEVFFPPEITVIKEETGKKRLSNYAIAKNGGHLPLAKLDGGGGIG